MNRIPMLRVATGPKREMKPEQKEMALRMPSSIGALPLKDSDGLTVCHGRQRTTAKRILLYFQRL
jgi:hypothetical protein